MDFTNLQGILIGFGGGAISGLIAYFASRNVNTATAAKTIAEAANALISPLEKRIDNLVAENLVRDNKIYELTCEVDRLKEKNTFLESENTDLKLRVKYLEEVLKNNGLSHLLKNK